MNAPTCSDAEKLSARRVQHLRHWDARKTSLFDKIGAGKYGTVFASAATPTTVLKESVTKVTMQGMCRQTFRENVIAILQTLLVLEGCTPHLPLHYGVSLFASAEQLRSHMYMERFAGSLIDLGPRVLLCAEDWQSLLFQVLSAVDAMSTVFHISHNDAYPRNILISPTARARRVAYRCHGTAYAVDWPFLAALTDFGIASSPQLMGERGHPEVADNLKPIAMGDAFGLRTSTHHILQYKDMPVFARDVYTVLKWIYFPTQGMPRAPASIRAWLQAALQLTDSITDQLHTPHGLRDLFGVIFSNRWMAVCALPLLVPESAPLQTDFACPLSDTKREHVLTSATRAMQSLRVQPSADCAFRPGCG